MTETKKRAATRMVPAPSHGIIPERDFHERPVLEARNLGIDFGGILRFKKLFWFRIRFPTCQGLP